MGIQTNHFFSTSSVEGWIVDLSQKGLSHSVIQSHLSGLRHYCHVNSIEAALNSPRIRLMLRTLKKRNASKVQPCLAVTRSELLKLCESGLQAGMIGIRFVAMITLAFYGFLRPSEFCKTSSSHAICWSDLKFGKQKKAVRVRLRSFKHSVTPAVVTIDASSTELDCPVRYLQSYMTGQVRIDKDGCVFGITADEFRREFSGFCLRAGIRTRLTPHSLRGGGATWAAKKGWPDVRIKIHGRWKSDAYKQYVKC